MGGLLAVKGTEISAAPCSVHKAAALLRRFLWTEAASEVGFAKSCADAVSQCLEEILVTRTKNSGITREDLRFVSAGRGSKFFHVEHVDKVPEIMKSQRGKGSKRLKISKEKGGERLNIISF